MGHKSGFIKQTDIGYILSEQFGMIRNDWNSLSLLLLIGHRESVSEVIARIGPEIPFR